LNACITIIDTIILTNYTYTAYDAYIHKYLHEEVVSYGELQAGEVLCVEYERAGKVEMVGLIDILV
jgi:hypothetical protein